MTSKMSVSATELLPEHEIGLPDVPVSVVVDGMQVLHSLGDSSLQFGICKLTLRCMLQVLPRVCEQMHVHLHGQNRRRLEHMSGVSHKQ